MNDPSHSKHVFLFGVVTSGFCIFGAVALAFAPGDNGQAVNLLLGTALPSALSATAGAMVSGGSSTTVESQSYTQATYPRSQPRNPKPISPEEDYIDTDYS